MFPLQTRILVVDDMNMIRAVIKGELRKLGFTDIVDVNDGEKACVVLQDEKKKNNPIQLVLSDWNMPKMTGIELLKWVRGHADFKKLPFIFITAEGEADQVKEALALSVSSYLRKPFSPADLTEKLSQVWANQAKIAS